MIIAKPEWFGPRKYTVWGLSIKTWQEADYIAIMFFTPNCAATYP